MKVRRLVDDPARLDLLKSYYWQNKSLGQIALVGDIEAHPRREHWEREINRLYYACGCDVGKIGLAIGLGWSTLGVLYQGTGWKTAVIVTGVLTLVGALAGKFYGMLRARRDLIKTIKEVQANWFRSDSSKAAAAV